MKTRQHPRTLAGSFVLPLGPERWALKTTPGILQRRYEIFLAFPLEFFLVGFEVCDERCDFFPLLSDSVLLFGHAHPF
jgi:hypothetical protein